MSLDHQKKKPFAKFWISTSIPQSILTALGSCSCNLIKKVEQRIAFAHMELEQQICQKRLNMLFFNNLFYFSYLGLICKLILNPFAAQIQAHCAVGQHEKTFSPWINSMKVPKRTWLLRHRLHRRDPRRLPSQSHGTSINKEKEVSKESTDKQMEKQ